jgi:nucleoside 2-deoxyribosyltransferase
MKVLVSYGAGDEPLARSLASALKRMVVSVLDPAADMTPRDSIAGVPRRAIEESDASVLVVPEAGSRGAIQAVFEAGAAKALGKPVVVVMSGAGDRELPSVADFAVLDAARQSSDEVVRTLDRALAAA